MPGMKKKVTAKKSVKSTNKKQVKTKKKSTHSAKIKKTSNRVAKKAVKKPATKKAKNSTVSKPKKKAALQKTIAKKPAKVKKNSNKLTTKSKKSKKNVKEKELTTKELMKEHEAEKLKNRLESSDDYSDESGNENGSPSTDSTQIYLKEIGYSPLLSAEEEIKYGRLVKKGDKKARQIMIESNLRLVVKIARHYYNRGLDFSDVIEEGNLGLMRAVEKFDPEKGFRFSTYATWWIRQTIECAIMNQTRTIRLPIHVVRELNSYLITSRELLQKNKQEPSQADIAREHDVPIENVSDMLELNERILSLDVQIANDASSSGRALVDAIPDDNSKDPTEEIEEEDLHQNLRKCLSELNDKQREVLCRRFGLDGYEKQTLEEVGEAVGLTRERVRQIQMSALKHLRQIMSREGVDSDFL